MHHQGGLEVVGEEAFSILTQFYEYDGDVPLDARAFDREEKGGSVREKIVFRGVRDGCVPGYLALPVTVSPPYPCVLLVHGLGASKEDWWKEATDEEQLARELLSSGFAVTALDIPYHGERTHNNRYESAWSMIVDHGRVNKYREMLVQSTGEHRRAIDYLATRPEIDAARIGILGRSVGGLVTFILTAVDPRVMVAVACATCPMSDYYVDRLGWDVAAKMRLAPVAPRNYAPAITRAAFLMLNGDQDEWGTVEDIRALHRLVGSTTKELRFFESGHRLPSAFVPKAVEWFRQHL